MDNLLDEIPFNHHGRDVRVKCLGYNASSSSTSYMYHHGHGYGNGNAHGIMRMPSPLHTSQEYSSLSRFGTPENIWSDEGILDSFRALNLSSAAATSVRAPVTAPLLSSGNPCLQYKNNQSSSYYKNNINNNIHYASVGRFPDEVESFGVEESLILQQRQYNSPRRNCGYANESVVEDYRLEVEGPIYHLAKDQDGCRYLQKKLEEGRSAVDKIFCGVIEHVVELMVNPFGNYLMQKLLDVCTQEQRMAIVLVLTSDPAKLVKICLNVHGTRSVQKVIETLETRLEVVLLTSSLQLGILELIKDHNGNHVVQRCLTTLPIEDNEFIFDAAVKHFVAIATHRHGCCVLQRFIDYSSGEYRTNLVAEVCKNGLDLAQDAFGNYVVQFVLELKDPVATTNLMSSFQGHFVNLSTQKFSSNVVEKCLKVLRDHIKARIVAELLAVPHFDQLLQDPYANYVIQSALVTTKGAMHEALAEAIRPYKTALRTNPYCKRIFSSTLLKK